MNMIRICVALMFALAVAPGRGDASLVPSAQSEVTLVEQQQRAEAERRRLLAAQMQEMANALRQREQRRAEQADAEALALAGQQPPPVNPPPPGFPGQPQPVNPPPPGQQPKATTPTPRPPTATPAPDDVPQRRMGLRGKDANLLIELTITDQTGTSAPEKKVVSMLVADQSMGRIRASSDARQISGFISTGLNVDARPVLLEGSADRILLEMTVEYAPVRPTEFEGKVQGRPTQLHESINVILSNGKSLVVSQAADPATDRKMTVEVKATIIK